MKYFPLLLALAMFSGCATQADKVHEAETSISAGHYEAGMKQLESLSRHGSSMEMQASQAALLRNRSIVAEKLNHEARLATAAEHYDAAEALYRKLLAIEPDNVQAKVDIERLQVLRERKSGLARAETLFRQGKMDDAETQLQKILLEDPQEQKAVAMMRKISDSRNKPVQNRLGPEFRKTISLEFRDAKLKDIFDAIWNASGINFILDRDVRTDVSASIFVHDVTVEEAIDGLLMTQQLEKKIVSARTLFIYPNTPQKVNEYQNLTVRNFFLAHADAKQIQSMLKTILKIKEVYIDEKRNLVVIRDSQDNVDMAEKLVRAHDQAEPEVMLALDVIEIQRSKLNELGIALPNQVDFGVGNPLTVKQLKTLNSSGINVGFGGLTGTPGPGVVGSVKMTDTDSDINMLANPRIRVRNGDKAKIHIGDRLPVVTTTTSAVSSFVGQTVNYLDVGLLLDVEPRVMLEGDVSVKINLEVSSAKQDPNNVGLYDVGTRTATTVLTLHDGETQLLAGLIRKDESDTTSQVPGIANIPILGRLFSDVTKSRGKTEIVLAITPHIIHNLVRPSADLMEYSSGPGSAAGGVYNPGPAPQAAFGGASGTSGFIPGRAVSPAPSQAPPSIPAAQPAFASPTAPAPAAQAQGGVIPMTSFAPPPGVGMKP